MVPGVFPADEVAAMDAEIKRVQVDVAAEKGYDDGWILRLGMRSEATRDVRTDERPLSLVEGIVHPGIAIYSAEVGAQAAARRRRLPLAPGRRLLLRDSQRGTRMSVWLPLHDSDEENGCLWVVPESHTWGLQQWEQKEGGYCTKGLIPPEDFDFSQAVSVPAWAGDVVLFSALLWQSSQGNRSDRLRPA